MKMQIKGILFDFDGTIANTIDLIIATFEHTCWALHRSVKRLWLPSACRCRRQ